MDELTAAEAAKTLEEAARQAHQVLESPTIFYDTKSMPGGIKTMQKCEAAYTLATSLCRKVASGELREVGHGHWEAVEPGHDILFRCSNCGRIISTSWGSCEDEDTHGNNGCDPTEEWLSCPTCGCVMDGGEKHE